MDLSPGTATPNLVRSPGFQRRRREAQKPATEPTVALCGSPGGLCFSRCPGIRATPHGWRPRLTLPTGKTIGDCPIKGRTDDLGRASPSLGRGDPAAGGCALRSAPWEADLSLSEETEEAAARVPPLPGDQKPSPHPPHCRSASGLRSAGPSRPPWAPQTHMPDGRSPAGPSAVSGRPGLPPPAAAPAAGPPTALPGARLNRPAKSVSTSAGGRGGGHCHARQPSPGPRRLRAAARTHASERAPPPPAEPGPPAAQAQSPEARRKGLAGARQAGGKGETGSSPGPPEGRPARGRGAV